MDFKKISLRVLITGSIFILLVKFGIRPNCNCNQPLTFVLGIAPNLVGSFLIPFFAYMVFSGRENLFARIFRIHSPGDLLQVCIIGFALLTVNEYLQLIPVFGRTFDYFDLLFSAVGLTASYLIFSKVYIKNFYSYYPD